MGRGLDCEDERSVPVTECPKVDVEMFQVGCSHSFDLVGTPETEWARGCSKYPD